MPRFHVLDDLEPYQCVEEQCPLPDMTWTRLARLVDHYATDHPDSPLMVSASISCPFCESEMAGTTDERFRHLGRHMEDLAFSVVPRQYEEWDFYTDKGSVE